MAKYRKTKCVHCHGGIEFPAHGVGEWVQCPHCAETTVLRAKRPLLRCAAIATVLISAVVVIAAFPSSEDADAVAEQARQRPLEQERQKAITDLALVQMEWAGRQYQQQQAERERRANALARLAEQRMEDRRHDELLAEMRQANRIAQRAAWDATFYQPDPPQTVVIQSPPHDWLGEWQKQQALRGIQYELQQMRFDNDFYESKRIRQSFQPVFYPQRYY